MFCSMRFHAARHGMNRAVLSVSLLLMLACDVSEDERSDLDWNFYVINTPQVNAFALPGGYIYVNRGR